MIGTSTAGWREFFQGSCQSRRRDAAVTSTTCGATTPTISARRCSGVCRPCAMAASRARRARGGPSSDWGRRSGTRPTRPAPLRQPSSFTVEKGSAHDQRGRRLRHKWAIAPRSQRRSSRRAPGHDVFVTSDPELIRPNGWCSRQGAMPDCMRELDARPAPKPGARRRRRKALPSASASASRCCSSTAPRATSPD